MCVYIDEALEGGLAKSVAQIKKGIVKQDLALTTIKAHKCADKLDATVVLDEEGRVTAKRYYNDLNALTFQSAALAVELQIINMRLSKAFFMRTLK